MFMVHLWWEWIWHAWWPNSIGWSCLLCVAGPFCLITLADGQVVSCYTASEECRGQWGFWYHWQWGFSEHLSHIAVGGLQVIRTCCHLFIVGCWYFPPPHCWPWCTDEDFDMPFNSGTLVGCPILPTHSHPVPLCDIVSYHVELSSVCWTYNPSCHVWSVLTLWTFGVEFIWWILLVGWVHDHVLIVAIYCSCRQQSTAKKHPVCAKSVANRTGSLIYVLVKPISKCCNEWCPCFALTHSVMHCWCVCF